jgi:putative hemolysin
MTPRREVEVIDLSEDSAEELREPGAGDSRRSRLPVQDGEADAIVGVIVVKDLVEFPRRWPANTQDLRVAGAGGAGGDGHGRLRCIVLREIRASRVHMALVFDEYGHFEGIITPGDVLEAIIGAFQEEEDESEPAIVTRADGSYLVAGWMQVDEFSHELGIPIPRDADFQTVAGFILAELNHLPNVGESLRQGALALRGGRSRRPPDRQGPGERGWSEAAPPVR